MIDRFGNPILVGWSEHEDLWLAAAMSLPSRSDRIAAYQDISELTGRSFAVVLRRAELKLEREATQRRRERSLRIAEARERRLLEPTSV